MKRAWVLVAMSALFLAGCHSRGMEKIMGGGSNAKTQDGGGFFTVACCQDNDGSNNLSWPAFVPLAHQQFCQRATTACHNADCQIDGNTYLPMHVDCAPKYGAIGSQYYPDTGY